MNKISLDLSNVSSFIGNDELDNMKGFVENAHKTLHNKTGAGNDFLGWLNLPKDYDKEEFARVKVAADKIKTNADILIVIGIGGSYLGARAAIELLSNNFHNLLSKEDRKTPQVIFAGNSISSSYLKQLLELVKDKEVAVNVISKSGTTTEPAIAFRFFEKFMIDKYGVEGSKERIFVTTDKARGALKGLADKRGYETFVIPDDVGGRFTVLTAVGLLPIAVAGIDVDSMMQGAVDAMNDYDNSDLDNNDCYKYAVVRNCMYRKNKTTEILVNYEPNFHYFNEWWKQLYGESEGKDQKGIFPASVDFTSDLHSMGQYIQDGLRNLFETVLRVGEPVENIDIEFSEEDGDGLNFLAGKSVDFVNKKALQGTVLAHVDGGVPNMIIDIPEVNAYNFGYLVYFFEKACAISGYILGVNPFNQPGVEEYKKNMFALLGKPGYEEEKAKLEKRL